MSLPPGASPPDVVASPWQLELGATVESGGVRFRVWAPRPRSVALKLIADGRVLPVERRAGDVGEVFVPGLGAGADYVYLLDGERERPDPVARHQPHGVHGPSRVVDPAAFAWSDGGWRGLPLEEHIFYELHVGCFTPEGTFDAAAARLPYLRDLGVTAIEIMPVAEFPGGRNWGYDGAHLYAPQASYGGPDGLRRLVDACHRHGFAAVLDVVYNHFGPEGTYLGEYAPFHTSRYRSPWGDAVNLDGPDSDGVRRHVIGNALYWQTEYHLDALRLDAVHGIFDLGAVHLLEEMATACRRQAAALGRPFHIVAESDLNDPRVIRPVEAGGLGIDAQWSDDFHHSVRTLLTDLRRDYLQDFGRVADLAKALTSGYVLDGGVSRYRRRRHGRSSADRPGRQFVVFVQNHDQVANASGGVRLTALTSLEAHKLAATLTLTSPYLPLLFMGEEYAETAPFLYFTSMGDAALAEAIREGRRREHEGFGHETPDPQAEATFARSRLTWSGLERAPHTQVLRFYRDLIALRRATPALAGCRKDLTTTLLSEEQRTLVVRRGAPAGGAALVLCNLADGPRVLPVEAGSWRRALYTADPAYGGPAGGSPPPEAVLASGATTVSVAPWSAVIYV